MAYLNNTWFHNKQIKINFTDINTKDIQSESFNSSKIVLTDN